MTKLRHKEVKQFTQCCIQPASGKTRFQEPVIVPLCNKASQLKFSSMMVTQCDGKT